MPKAVDIRKGQVVEWDGQLWIVHDATHVAKGNKRSYMQMKFKNFKAGNVIDQRFGVDDRIDTPFIEDRQYEYLYRDGDNFVVMDLETFDQLHVSKDLAPEAERYLKGNERVSCKILDGRVLSMELPNTVELEVKDTPPTVKGATVTNQSKEATMETGLRVRVPPFIQKGEMLRVDTRTGNYIERAK